MIFPSQNYTLNNLLIITKGSIRTVIEQWAESKFDIEVQILEENFASEIVIGRDFFEQGVTLIYVPNNKKEITHSEVDDSQENNEREANETAFLFPQLDINETVTTVIEQITEIEIDFDDTVKKRLIQLLEKIENTNFPTVEDDYAVRLVSLNIRRYTCMHRTVLRSRKESRLEK